MKLNNVFVRFFALLLVVFIGLSGAWLWWRDAVAPVDPTNNIPEQFIIKKGDDVREIASSLGKQNLVRSSTGFYLTVKMLGIERNIQAGNFRLKRSMNAEQIARELTTGMIDTWVQTLEGWRIEEVATRLAKELEIPEKEFLQHAREGYMFPDTYLIPQDASPAAVAKIFFSNFENKIAPLKSEIEQSKLSLNEIVTLASIIEREGSSDLDRPMIAGVLLKRLSLGMPLQADATVQYALGYQADAKTWWKRVLTAEDLKIKSPYNTYAVNGLPPGPISNPGIKSIQAVLRPVQSDYLYYLHDSKGNVHFGRTLDEHNANIDKYLR